MTKKAEKKADNKSKKKAKKKEKSIGDQPAGDWVGAGERLFQREFDLFKELDAAVEELEDAEEELVTFEREHSTYVQRELDAWEAKHRFRNAAEADAEQIKKSSDLMQRLQFGGLEYSTQRHVYKMAVECAEMDMKRVLRRLDIVERKLKSSERRSRHECSHMLRGRGLGTL